MAALSESVKESRKATPSPQTNLLAGEDPSTELASDARRWLSIYRELLEFNQELLGRLRRDLEKTGPAERNADDTRLEAELERLQQRVRFWEDRYPTLTASIDFDKERGIVFGDRAAVRLSHREHQLLLWLFQHPDHYFTPRALAARAWSQPGLSPEQVRSYVVRLRRLLETAGARGRIESRRGLGYRLRFEADES